MKVNEAKAVTIFWSICFLLAYFSAFMISGREVPIMDLDDSWMVVLEQAFVKKLQFGKDIVFTYGPLGFLNATASQGQLLVLRVSFGLLWSAVAAVAAVDLTRRLYRPVRFIFFPWFLLFSNFGQLEQHMLLIMGYGCILLLEGRARSRFVVVVCLALFALFSLIKLTFLIAAVAGLSVATAVLLYSRKYLIAGAIPAVFSLFVIGFWWLSGQRLAHLPLWLSSGFYIVSGYSEAMFVQPAAGLLPVAIMILTCCFIAAAVILVQKRHSAQDVGMVLIVSIYLFLTWKQGFVRADPGHTIAFLFTVPLLFCLFLREEILGTMSARVRQLLFVLYVVTVLLCGYGTTLEKTTSLQARLLNWPRMLSGQMQMHAGIALRMWPAIFEGLQPAKVAENVPRMTLAQRIIGTGTVDVINYKQWAALANGLNYQPRPIIQGYSAYTELLQELNLSYFRGKAAPAYLLATIQSIDKRFPTLDDAPTLLQIINNYRPVAKDNSFLVMERIAARTTDLKMSLVQEKTISFHERVDLTPFNGSPLVMQVEMHPTLSGKLLKTLYHQPLLQLEAITGTQSTSYRFVPAMATSGFLLNPLVKDNNALIDLLQGNGQRLDAIRFTREDAFIASEHDRITIRLFRVEELLSSPKSQEENVRLDKWKMKSFDLPEPQVFSLLPAKFEMTEGTRTMALFSPSQIKFKIPAGAAEFTGCLGVQDRAGNAEEIEFTIDAFDDDGKSRRLYSRLVRPKRDPGDQGKLRFIVYLDSAQDKYLVCSASKGPSNEAKPAWAYWATVDFH